MTTNSAVKPAINAKVLNWFIAFLLKKLPALRVAHEQAFARRQAMRGARRQRIAGQKRGDGTRALAQLLAQKLSQTPADLLFQFGF
jgi:hypothetical protein